MKTVILAILLVSSIGVNGVIVVRHFTLPATEVQRISPQEVAAKLKGAGLSARTVRYAVIGDLEILHAKEYERLSHLVDQPWLQGSRQARSAIEKLSADEKLEAGRLVSANDRVDKEPLSAEFREPVAEIEQRHGISAAPILAFDDPSVITFPPADRLFSELNAAIDEIDAKLGAECFEQYRRYRTPAALIVQRNLSGIEVPEPLYLQLVRLTDEALARTSSDRIDDQLTLLRRYREVLGDSLFCSILSTISWDGYNDFDQMAAAGIPAEQRIERFLVVIRVLALAPRAAATPSGMTIGPQVTQLLAAVPQRLQAEYGESRIGKRLKGILASHSAG